MILLEASPQPPEMKRFFMLPQSGGRAYECPYLFHLNLFMVHVENKTLDIENSGTSGWTLSLILF